MLTEEGPHGNLFFLCGAIKLVGVGSGATASVHLRTDHFLLNAEGRRWAMGYHRDSKNFCRVNCGWRWFVEFISREVVRGGRPCESGWCVVVWCTIVRRFQVLCTKSHPYTLLRLFPTLR